MGGGGRVGDTFNIPSPTNNIPLPMYHPPFELFYRRGSLMTPTTQPQKSFTVSPSNPSTNPAPHKNLDCTPLTGKVVIKYRTRGGGGRFCKNLKNFKHQYSCKSKSDTPTEIATKISCPNKINSSSPKTRNIKYDFLWSLVTVFS